MESLFFRTYYFRGFHRVELTLKKKKKISKLSDPQGSLQRPYLKMRDPLLYAGEAVVEAAAQWLPASILAWTPRDGEAKLPELWGEFFLLCCPARVMPSAGLGCLAGAGGLEGFG